MVTLFLLILAGFVLLIAGADFIVKSSVAMANKLKIPPLIVGLTVVAFGTSAPEFVVSLTSALSTAEAGRPSKARCVRGAVCRNTTRFMW